MTRSITPPVVFTSSHALLVAPALVWAAIALSPPDPALAQPPRTRVVMLGTGTPIPDPARSGPAVVVVVDSTAYLFDAGVGVMRRAVEAGRRGVAAFATAPSKQPNPRFDRVFLTHLHSDHTLGLADVIFTPWIQGRVAPLDVYGPTGTARLVTGILDGNATDIAERIAAPGAPSPDGWRVVVHDVKEGLVFEDARIRVRAFAVDHGGWEEAFGYRIETPDRTIVISGDTGASMKIAQHCRGCDVFVHEVFSNAGWATIPAARQPYHARAHTSASELGAIAVAARPGLLVLYHQLYFGVTDSILLGEVRASYSGKVVSAQDLDIF